MKAAASDMDLIFFMLGGEHFGAPAQGLQSIAAADWAPERDCDRRLDLYSILDLQRRSGARVLLVKTRGGILGIQVDEISARMIGSHKVLPVPQGLGAWLEVQAIAGIAVDPDHGMIPVLDLDALAQGFAPASGKRD